MSDTTKDSKRTNDDSHKKLCTCASFFHVRGYHKSDCPLVEARVGMTHDGKELNTEASNRTNSEPQETKEEPMLQGLQLFPGIPTNHHDRCARYIGRIGWVQVDGEWMRGTVTGAHFPSDLLSVYIDGDHKHVEVRYGDFYWMGDPASA